ncbi:J domain-containing protein [Dyella sp. A6]|uniref:J domain-containing protein n=1 Tax=Dyella aluminiiresistens TaxID=3069105 RepID=UPI002E7884B5|nr:J domain-containing protein [Dyella sp. A6]
MSTGLMSPFEQLGLPSDADERMVKRAYAQRLRHTRPDSDPEGFQRLHAIYQAALAVCRERPPQPTPARAIEPVTEPASILQATAAPATPPTPPLMPSPAPLRAEPARPAVPTPFPFERFCNELLTMADAGDAPQLRAWLDEQPALWSLRLKAQVGHELFARLYRDAPPMPAACLDTLLAFFDMNHARSGHDPLALQRLQRRMQLAWELQPAHRDALATRLGIRGWNTRGRERRRLDRQLQQLERPFHWTGAIPTALWPNAASRLARLILQLSLQHPRDLPSVCDSKQVRFWLEAADRRQVSKPRLILGGIRCIATLLGSLLLGLLLGVLTRLPPERFAFGALEFTVGAAFVLCLIWAAWMALLPLDDWHAMPEHQPARWPWLNLLLVPALCGVGLAVWIPAGHNPLAMIPLVAAVWLALRRLARRNITRPGFSPRLIWVALYLGAAVLSSLSGNHGQDNEFASYTYLLAVAATIMWCIDLWRHRHVLRIRRRAA